MGKRKFSDLSEAAQKRFIAIKMTRSFRPYIREIFRIKLRISLMLSERKRKVELDKTINIYITQCRNIEDSKFQALKDLMNIALYFLLAERDIQSVKVDALSHPDEWRRRLLLRVMLLTIHELDISKVASSKKMNEIYELAGTNSILKHKMTEALRSMRRSHEKAEKLLSHARNTTIAHRDSSALQQYNTIMSLDAMEVMKVSADFYDGARQVLSVVPELILQVGDIQSLFRQYMNSK